MTKDEKQSLRLELLSIAAEKSNSFDEALTNAKTLWKEFGVSENPHPNTTQQPLNS